jgi:Ion channel
MASPIDRDAERAIRRLIRSFASVDSYGLVVVMIAVTYVLAVWLNHVWGATLVVFVQIATVRLALHTSQARRPMRHLADGLFVVAGLCAILNLFVRTDEELVAFVFLASGLLYVFAPFAIIRHIAFRREVDRETMLGALAAYLLIGMAFAFVYRFLAEVQRGPFFGPQGDGTIADDLFFSFITLTTTGYGNLVPEGNPGQSIAVLEALLGQLFLVTAVSKLVNLWQPRAWRDRTDPT